MSLTLHYHPLSSFCWKALIALYESGVPFTPKLVDLGNAAGYVLDEQVDQFLAFAGILAVDEKMHLGGGRCEPEFDRRGWQPEEIGEGEELEELRAARTLRREPAVGREPAPLATVGPVEAETLRRARQPREERGLRAPSEVERHVVTACTQAREKRLDRAQTGAPLEHEDVVEPGMTCEQRRRRRLDEPGDARIGAAAPDAPEQRQRAHDVADGAREDDQQAHGSPPRAP